ncbi:hypothetical protein Tco_0752713 [Tanacetum coccineum]|uniref:Uncharacterized protein n=1 Tax=Tanacetum coccineum TaxID=301880 RepID=A0ABQ4ZB01_9ASTR
MAQVAYVSASVVEEGDSETVSQFPRGRLSMVLAREVCVNVRKVGEYRRISHDLKKSVRRLSVSIHELRALGDCGDGNESLNLLERLRLENVEKAVRLRLMMKETHRIKCSSYIVTVNVDSRLAWEIKAFCDRLIDIIEEKENFVIGLEALVGQFVPEKMCEFSKANQEKDIPNLMKLHILGREFELRAREKNLFIKRLKGECRVLIMFIGITITLELAKRCSPQYVGVDTPYLLDGYDGRLGCKGVTKQIVGVIPKGLALRVVLVDHHSKGESGKGFKLEVN